MNRGFYMGASAMNLRAQELEVIANNLANVNTVGFKEGRVTNRSFADYLTLQQVDLGENGVNSRPLGVMTTGGSQPWLNYAVHTQGPLKYSGNPLDLALAGDGFFAVETPDGIRYTRSGNFTLDSEGTLLTQSGNAVMSDRDRPITLTGNGPIQISADGTITQDGQEAGQLKIVAFNQINMMRPEGRNLYGYAGGTGEELPSDASVRQGYVEHSNVDSMRAMVRMIEVTRAFESAQKVVSTQDEVLSGAVNTLGRVKAG